MRLVALCVTGLFAISCTKSVYVPPTSYDEVESSRAKHWRVKTTDEQTYWVERFTITDTTLVIEQASRLYTAPGETEPQNIEESDLPIVLPLSEVAALERREISMTRTSLVVVPLVLAGVVLYAIGKSFENFGGGN